MNNNYTKFTEEMKKTHTILIPNMLPIHFTLIKQIFETKGYKMGAASNLRPANRRNRA